MRKFIIVVILIILSMILLLGCGNRTSHKAKVDSVFSSDATITVSLEKGEKYLGFSIDSDDSSVWISVSDSAGIVHIYQVMYRLSGKFNGNVIVKEYGK